MNVVKTNRAPETYASHLAETVRNTLANQPWRGICRQAVVPKVAEHDCEDASFSADLTMSIQWVSERYNVDVDSTEDD